MKAIQLISYLLLLFFTINCARPTKNTSTKKPVITVSILPQKYLVEQLVDDIFEINVMVPPGASPADYEPTPKQMVNLSESEIYFYIGHLGFENAWIERLEQNAKNTKFVSLSHGISLIEEACESEHSDGHHHHGADPHIWTSPKLVQQFSEEMLQVLVTEYPEYAARFTSNFHKFSAVIDSIDQAITIDLNSRTQHSFMIFHPALGYFARDYNLQQHSIEFEGKSPSTAHLKSIIDLVRAEKINTIFIQSQFETEKALAVADETKTKVVTIDPLAENWLNFMVDLQQKMKIALSGD